MYLSVILLGASSLVIQETTFSESLTESGVSTKIAFSGPEIKVKVVGEKV